MRYLSYLEGVAQIRELTGLAHHSSALQDLQRMLAANHFAVMTLGARLTSDGRDYRAIFFSGLCIIESISRRDSHAASVRADGIALKGGPLDLPSPGAFPPIVLGGVDFRADSTEISLNFARPFNVQLEVRAANPGDGNFVLLFAIEYEGKLLRCKSNPVRAQLSGKQQMLQFDIPEVITTDPNVAEFLEASTFVRLASVFFALSTETAGGTHAIQSNWAFGFLPANYVD